MKQFEIYEVLQSSFQRLGRLKAPNIWIAKDRAHKRYPNRRLRVTEGTVRSITDL